jgi:glutaredoxin
MGCAQVKEFLSKQGVTYTELDVSKDDDALHELKKRGIMTTPVTFIDGEAVTGFDQEKIEALLK